MVGPLEHAAHGRHDNHCTGDCSRVLFRGFPAVAGKRSSRLLHSDQVDADWGMKSVVSSPSNTASRPHGCK